MCRFENVNCNSKRKAFVVLFTCGREAKEEFGNETVIHKKVVAPSASPFSPLT